MKIKANELKDLIMDVAVAMFGSKKFRRRELLSAVESELRARGLWEPKDDLQSFSVDPKSKGLANIDYSFSSIAREGRLTKTERNSWQVNKEILSEYEINEEPEANQIILIVKSESDQRIIRFILQAANLPVNRVQIQAIGSISAIKKWIGNTINNENQNYAILIDADELNVPDSKELVKERLGYPPFPVFCAVPEIEAWLFADDKTARIYAGSEKGKEIFDRLPLPEQIPYPKQVAFQVFGRGKNKVENFHFLTEIDIERATSRSPSLKDFLKGVSDLIDDPISFERVSITNIPNRNIFINLINEVTNSETILWRTVNGSELTAGELREEIQQGSPIGMQYISEVLRVARDLISRESRKK